MRLLCIGDSNTYGYDPRSYLGSRYPEDVRWTGRLQSSRLIEFEVMERGVNGMTAERQLAIWRTGRAAIGARDADLIVLMLGTNDLLEGRSAEETAALMGALIDQIPGDRSRVLLVAPPHLKPGEWVYREELIWESVKLGKLYRELADQKGCMFADAGEWDVELTFDGVHFSPEGHRTFAEKLAGHIIRKTGLSH